MKHALLILCHTEPKQVEHLLRFFDEDFDCYIHLDRKAKIEPGKWIWLKTIKSKVRFYSKYKIRWGGFSILKTELFLLNEIVKSGQQYDYVHFLSGQDYPIKNLNHIKKFFEEHKGKEFIEYVDLPYKQWEQGTYKRFQYYYLNDWIDYQTLCGCKLIDNLICWQQKSGMKRRIPDQFDKLYGGSNWMSLTGECAAYIIHNQQQYKSFYNRLKYTFAPDEVYFHTLILNSSFAASVKNDSLRYISWVQNFSSPTILTERDWWNIVTTDCLFARKFDWQISAQLIFLIKKYIQTKDTVSITTHGYWQSASYAGHYYDNGLAKGLIKLLPFMNVKTIADLGCGPGWYVALFRRNGYDANGYDGNPNVEEMSAPLFGNGFYCQCVDLTDELEAEEPFDLIFSLEVGEHIPAQWEDIYLTNLTRNAVRYVLLSWAIEGQTGDGHVNCRPNSYIINKMKEQGFAVNTPVSNYLRKYADSWWLKHTIMLFERI